MCGKKILINYLLNAVFMRVYINFRHVAKSTSLPLKRLAHIIIYPIRINEFI